MMFRSLGFAGGGIGVLVGTFLWAAPPSKDLNKEVELIGAVVRARQDYKRSLISLKAFYSDRGDVQKLNWAEHEMAELEQVTQYAYRIEAEIAGPGLKATQSVPAADTLYAQAMDYKQRDRLNLFKREENYKKAAKLFTRLVREHATSNKIDDAAYQLGDIYASRSFKDYYRAALWFERVADWNPGTTTDARFRAAQLYEDHLHDRRKAIELYKGVLEYDTSDKRLRAARKQLQKLTVGGP